MLRLLLALLLLANAVVLAWTQGWWSPWWPAPQAAGREPERMAAQLRPETVVVMAGPAASAAITAARLASQVCLEAGPLLDAQIPAAEAALAAMRLPDGQWQREDVAQPPGWLVYSGRWNDAATLRAKSAELQRAGVEFEVLQQPPELAPGLVLSRHATREQAEAAVAALTTPDKPGAMPRVRGIRAVGLALPPAQHWLRVPRADVEQQERLQALAADAAAALGGGFKPCAARP